MKQRNVRSCLVGSIASTRVLNHRAENSHQPMRLREKKMRRFRISPHRPKAFSLLIAPLLGISNRDVTV
jgi:transposase-like protein